MEGKNRKHSVPYLCTFVKVHAVMQVKLNHIFHYDTPHRITCDPVLVLLQINPLTCTSRFSDWPPSLRYAANVFLSCVLHMDKNNAAINSVTTPLTHKRTHPSVTTVSQTMLATIYFLTISNEK